MTRESDFWATVRRALTPYGRVVRIESGSTASGIPDVSYCLLGHAGWLELKQVAEWPKRATTPLRIDHLTLEQVLFLEQWAAFPARGRAHGLFRVANDVLLLDAATVRCVFDRTITRADLLTQATVHGTGTFPTLAIVRALTHISCLQDAPSVVRTIQT